MNTKLYLYFILSIQSIIYAQKKNSFQLDRYFLKECKVNKVVDNSLYEISKSIANEIIIYRSVLEMDKNIAKSLLVFMNEFLQTKKFNKICQIKVSRFTIGKDGLSPPLDEIQLYEWLFENEKDTESVLKQLNRLNGFDVIPRTYGSSWKWLKMRNKIYFLYTETYDEDAREFCNIFKLVNKIISEY